MAINKAIYKQMNKEGTEFNEIHFKTDIGMVEVLDNNNESKGNLDTLLVKGKSITSGDIKDIKTNGKYRIKGLTGVPGGTISTDEHMLEVITIGEDINQPTLINYILTDKNGYMYYRTITDAGRDSGWSSGGTGVKNMINSIINNIGATERLKTKNKVLVDAINELVEFKDSASEDLSDLNSKDFDEWYVRRDRTSYVTADTNIQPGKGFFIKIDGGISNLIKSDLSGNVLLGSGKTAINMYSNGVITHNGKKIWTEDNDGKGSGLDADYLGGVHSSRYITSGSDGSFNNRMSFKSGLSIGRGSRITWDNGIGITMTNQSGEVNMSFQDSSAREYASINSKTGIHSSSLNLTGSGSASQITMKGRSSDRGFAASVNNSTGEFKFVNSQNGAVLFRAGKTDKGLNLGSHVEINGRHLYIQPNKPPTNVPFGSIWIRTVE